MYSKDKYFMDAVTLANRLVKTVKTNKDICNGKQDLIVEAYLKYIDKTIECYLGFKQWDSFPEAKKEMILNNSFELFVEQMKSNSEE